MLYYHKKKKCLLVTDKEALSGKRQQWDNDGDLNAQQRYTQEIAAL
jgi:hypothetical protein